MTLMLPPARLNCVTVHKATVHDSYPLVQTAHRTEVSSELGGIRTAVTSTPEELGLCEVVASVGGSPQRVCVTDGQVLPFEDWLHYVNDQTAAWRKALGAVRATAVFEQGSLVVNRQVRGLRQGHLVTVHLRQESSVNYGVEHFSRRRIRITVFWDMTSCILVDRNQRFGLLYCF